MSLSLLLFYEHSTIIPLVAYLKIAKEQYGDRRCSGSYNVGPDDCDCVATGELAGIFCECWGEGARWESRSSGGPHEANFLKLDCSKLKKTFGWQPRWHVREAVERTVEWAKAWIAGADMAACMDRQIEEFLNDE